MSEPQSPVVAMVTRCALIRTGSTCTEEGMMKMGPLLEWTAMISVSAMFIVIICMIYLRLAGSV